MQSYFDVEMEADESGYFNTRDLGFINGDDELFLVGIVKDMINLGGRKVDPSEVEEILNSIAFVGESAVYPGVNAIGDEFVQAALQLEEGYELNPDELTAICAEHLEPHKIPLRFHEVDELPRSPSGKCLKIHCPDWATAS
jgi:long-chain acyl-CoA synthetase